MDSFIQFKDVKKTYKVGDIEIHASNGVNFEVNKGEFVVIVGPSGARKNNDFKSSWRNGSSNKWIYYG